MAWLEISGEVVTGDLKDVSVTLARDHAAQANRPRYVVDVRGTLFLVSEIIALTVDALRQLPNRLDDCAAAVSRKRGQPISASDVRRIITDVIDPMLESGDIIARHNGFLFKRCLIPAPVVLRIAASFASLFRPLVATVMCIAICASIALMYMNISRDGFVLQGYWQPALVICVFILTCIFHEIGHAAALRFHGEKPGQIGFGLFIVFPVFFANVTNAWRLSRAGRISVDLGGIYLQSIFIPILIIIYTVSGLSSLLLICWLIVGVILFNLSPLLKLDGYWLLVDIFGSRDIGGRAAAIVKNLLKRRTASIDEMIGVAIFYLGGAFYIYWIGHAIWLFVIAKLESGASQRLTIDRTSDIAIIGWQLVLYSALAGWLIWTTFRMIRAMIGRREADLKSTTAIPTATSVAYNAQRSTWQDIEKLVGKPANRA